MQDFLKTEDRQQKFEEHSLITNSVKKDVLYDLDSFLRQYHIYVENMRREKATGRILSPSDGGVFGSNRAEMSFLLSRSSAIETVCETGFNGGSSAFIWLTNPYVKKVYSFDLMEKEEKKNFKFVAKDYLQTTFPGKLEVIEGDSTISVPKFVKENPHVKCDLVLADGGHGGDIPYHDLNNLSQISHSGTLVLVDDYGNCSYCGGVTKSFDRLAAERIILKIACSNTCYKQYRGGHSIEKQKMGLENPYFDCEDGHYFCYARYTAKLPSVTNI